MKRPLYNRDDKRDREADGCMSFLGDSCLGCLFETGCSAIGCGILVALLLIAGLTTGVIESKRLHQQVAVMPLRSELKAHE